MKKRIACLGFVALCSVPSFAQYQPPAASPSAPSPDTYGTTAETAVSVSQWAFTGVDSSCVFAVGGAGFRYCTAGSAFLHADVQLPEGALITGVELQACDTNNAVSATGDLVRFFTSAGAQQVANIGTPASTGATPGCGRFRVTFNPAVQVDNATNVYTVRAILSATDGSLQLGGMRVFYKLQISPAPNTATFGDVPVGSTFHRFVEALVAAGITGGCGNGNYCPDAPVTRGQIAVFLSAALGLHFAP